MEPVYHHPESDQSAIEKAFQKLEEAINAVNDCHKTFEGQKLPKLRDRSNAFVKRAIAYAQEQPNLVPGFLDIPALVKEYRLSLQMDKLFSKVQELAKTINNTALWAGSKAIQRSFAFYQAVLKASMENVPGTEKIVEDMQKSFLGNDTAA